MSRWAMILAAGEGARIRALTRNERGEAVPKQYWAPDGSRPLLLRSLERAGRLIPPDHTVVVVAEHHRPWWKVLVGRLPRGNILIQPFGRGTGVGVLFPLLHIYSRDRDAIVAIYPSDHFVESEAVLAHSFHHAFRRIEAGRHVLVLGMKPDHPDPGYGWVLADPPEPDRTRRIHAFFEKPGPTLARHLFRRGAVWSTLMVAGRVDALLAMYETAARPVLRLFATTFRELGRDRAALEQLYRIVPPIDFSRDILQRVPERLRVLVVPPCGWTDMGTPERVRRWREARREVTGRHVETGMEEDAPIPA